PLRRELIGTVRSKGSANIKAVSDDLLYELQTQSFTVAINNLLSSQEFYEMTEKQSREDKVNFGKFTIKNEKKYFKTLYEIVDFSRKSTVTVRAGQGIGSGFAIGDGGYIVTNHHVVRDATKVIVVTSDGIEIESNVVASDKGRDIALIKLVNNIRLRPLYLESKYSIGEKVYAIGNPLDESLSGTFTSGIVSSDRVMDGFNYIQSDTAINPGNSGGPLLNEEGSVIGISTMGIMNAQGLNFFVPVI
ncbi:MAG: trypsin-like peptidase domain-containing protein, partial [Candidatus Neomarinimicrobiota bacterium]